MQLTGIDCQIPSSKIFNEEIIELVKFYSASHFNGRLTDLESTVRRILKLTGIKSRFWRTKMERPIELLKTASERALKMAGLQKKEIDLVIYSSIDRGFIEPANASFICNSLGLEKARSFDVVDACMGWGTAVYIAHSFLHGSSSVNSVMIVNAEFPMDEKGSVLPNNFTINDTAELHWKSPSFTLGEGASVCIFQNKNSSINKFESIEAPQFAELCTIPLSNFEKYLSNYSGTRIASDVQFNSFGSEMFANGLNSAVTVLHNLLKSLDYVPKIIFPHSVSNKIIHEAELNANLKSLVFSTFEDLGNIATVSIPSSLNKALTLGLINQNEKCVAWIASAGMKFSAFEIHL